MGLQSVAHASAANFLTGWVRDLPKIATKIGQPNVEAVLQRASPLEILSACNTSLTLWLIKVLMIYHLSAQHSNFMGRIS